MIKDEMLTTKEAAKMLGVTTRTVTRMVLSGKLPNAIKVGDYSKAPLLIPKSSIIAYLKSME